MLRFTTLILILTAYYIQNSESHGMLMDPVSRSSAWRSGFPTPANYDDNGLFCGGVAVSYNFNYVNLCIRDKTNFFM